MTSAKSIIPVEMESALLHAYKTAHPEETIGFFRKSKAVGDSFQASTSILGLKPYETLQCDGGANVVTTRTKVFYEDGHPFTALEQRMKHRLELLDHPFFKGGAMGYFSFDAVRFLEDTLPQVKKQVSESRFDAEVVFFQFYLLFDHEAKTVEILNILGDESGISELEKELGTLLEKYPHTPFQDKAVEPYPVEKMQSLYGKDAFLKDILRLKEHIRDGDIFQAVLSERFQAPFTGDPLQLFETLSRISPAPYQFYFTIEGRHYFGASPEMLLQNQGGELETHPIAGTRPRGNTPEEEAEKERELLADTKEKAEHLMLVDLSRNDLGRVSSPGTVKVESFQKVRKFGGVMHLVSVVKGMKIDSLSPIRAFSSCFPAGTLSGAPKIRAMQLLSGLEREPRGFYGGAFIVSGFDGDIDSCISIRSISVVNGVASIQAGAGIVADSVPETEYAEVLHKTRLTRLALAKVSQS